MKKVVSLVLFLALVVAIVLYASGAFQGEQVEPGTLEAPPGEPAPAETIVVDHAEVQVYEDAVGTVQSRTEVSVSAQIQARVLHVAVDAGAQVDAKDLLVRLDDRELQAKKAQAAEALAQAKAAVDRAAQAKASAEAVLVQSRQRRERVKGLLEENAATPEQMEEAEAGFLQAQAGVAEADAAIAVAKARVEQAAQAVNEADVALSYTTIEAPISGVISMKAVEPGDLAWPGKTLFEIIDPEELRLEAQVREGLIGHVSTDANLQVLLPAADLTLDGNVAEICPTADPTTRTFRVRVHLDARPDVRPGMFGRLRIPRGTREVVRVPRRALLRTGQLAYVLVKQGERWTRRLVTTGLALPEESVEILSGLEGGEQVGLPEVR